MNRRGFTLIEVMLAVVLLAIVLVSIARYTGQFLHTVSTSSVRTVAAEVARERISLVDMDPSYNTLAATWTGIETGFPGYPNMSRVTTVSRISGIAPPRDYTVVTVRVTEPTMGQAIDVTTVVAQP
ncbi:MAG: prepilin-type N-terminal cleavage/methylation domain-containing protein [Gemmatimonadales bacterium]